MRILYHRVNITAMHTAVIFTKNRQILLNNYLFFVIIYIDNFGILHKVLHIVFNTVLKTRVFNIEKILKNLPYTAVFQLIQHSFQHFQHFTFLPTVILTLLFYIYGIYSVFFWWGDCKKLIFILQKYLLLYRNI